jgi:hypothetical protein
MAVIIFMAALLCCNFYRVIIQTDVFIIVIQVISKPVIESTINNL